MPATKPLFIPGRSLVEHEDATFSEITRQKVDLTYTGADETAAKLNALLIVGVTAGETAHVHADLKAAGVIALSVEVELLTDFRAEVIIHWGVPVDPILDKPPLAGGWVVETSSESVREMRALDVNLNQITQKYLPPGQPDPGFYGEDDAELRFKPGTPVGAFDTIVHLYARRHISHTAAANFPQWAPPYGAPLQSWPVAYTNWANKQIVRKGIANVPAGVWLCRGVRLTTRNNGWSWLVGAEFIYREWGWEDYSFFTYTGTGLNQIPSNLDIPAGMKTPWPTVRASTGGVFGAIRPQMLKGLKNFALPPFELMLDGYSPE